jgi:chromobox protein 5
MSEKGLISTTFWSLDDEALKFNGAQIGALRRKRKSDCPQNDHQDQAQKMKQNENDSLPTMMDEEYLVESILGKREHNGTKQYLIKWEGYGEVFSTWEDEKNLNCPDVVAEFEKKVEPAKREKLQSEEKREEDESFQEGDQITEVGLEFGDEIEEILNIQVINGQLTYYVSWKGKYALSYVPALIVGKVAREKVAEFFKDRIKLTFVPKW